MELDDEVQEHLHLSGDFLRSAERDVRDGLYAPARLSLLHALELGLKAALLAKTGRPWGTHVVHGPFGQHFRGRIDERTLGRLNRLVQEYGRSRYPDWEAPTEATMNDDLTFVRSMVEETIPALVAEVHP